MKNRVIILLTTLMCIWPAADLSACTSVIIPAKYNFTGKPLMVKIRDQRADRQISGIQQFEGERYSFLGYVPTTNRPHSMIREIVGGMNEAGLCFASLTSHSFRRDTTVDHRYNSGTLQFTALGKCKNIEEFDSWLESQEKPLGAVFNLAVIDAYGQAACYEFNGVGWTKYDANDPEYAADGYLVITNFSWSGQGGAGFDRYASAVATMKQFKKNSEGKFNLTPADLYRGFGRNYANGYVGIESLRDIKSFEYFSDKGFIYHHNTCGMLTFEGVAPGTNPKYCVLWTQLGFPVCSPAIPLVVSPDSTIPDYIYRPDSNQPKIFKRSFVFRDRYIYNRKDQPQGESNMNYFSTAGVKTCVEKTAKIESYIERKFRKIHNRWYSGRINDDKFYKSYADQTAAYYAYFEKIYND